MSRLADAQRPRLCAGRRADPGPGPEVHLCGPSERRRGSRFPERPRIPAGRRPGPPALRRGVATQASVFGCVDGKCSVVRCVSGCK